MEVGVESAAHQEDEEDAEHEDEEDEEDARSQRWKVRQCNLVCRIFPVRGCADTF